MNLRQTPEPMLLGDIGDVVSGILAPISGLLSPRQGRVLVNPVATPMNVGLVTTLVIGVVALAVLKKKRMI